VRLTAGFKSLFVRFQGNGKDTATDSRHQLRARPSRDDVIQAFRLILGREPENDVVIEAHMRVPSIAELRNALLRSDEFAGKFRTMHPVVGDHPNLNRGRRAVVFIHLQKTGGTSLREIIGKQFLPERRCPIFEDKLHVLTLAELGRYDFFAGHYDMSCLGFIPRDVIDTFAMFREPRARLISFYRFLRSHPAVDEFAGDQLIPLAHALTAEQFYERSELRRYSAINNHYLFALGRSFSWFDQNRESLSKKMLSSVLLDAKLQVHALTALGITEQFRESVDLISGSLALKSVESIESLHVTDNFSAVDSRFRRVEPVEVTRRLAEGMKDLIEYDNVLYDYAVNEFRRRRQRVAGVSDRISGESRSAGSATEVYSD
jgi:hypothetical protein